MNCVLYIFTSGHKRTDKHVDIVNISEISSDLQNDVCPFHPSSLWSSNIDLFALYEI
jgi:hypothetical protein